jgi:hypothetical protein
VKRSAESFSLNLGRNKQEGKPDTFHTKYQENIIFGAIFFSFRNVEHLWSPYFAGRGGQISARYPFQTFTILHCPTTGI